MHFISQRRRKCFWMAGALFLFGTSGSAQRVTEFRGLVAEKQVTLVYLAVGKERPSWVKVGATAGTNAVVSVDVDREVATFRDEEGVEYSLPLQRAKLLKAESEPKPHKMIDGKAPRPSAASVPGPVYEVYEQFPPVGTKRSNLDVDWDFIKSDRNPYRDRPDLFLTEYRKASDWLLLSDEQKSAFVETLRQHGWHLQVVASSHGLTKMGAPVQRDGPAETVYPSQR